MCRKRVLLLVDFSLSGYAAHYAVVKMHDSEPLDVVLLVVGIRGRFPAPASVGSFAEMMAEAHRAQGGLANVRFSNGHPDHAVQEMLLRERFSLVVTGSELAGCLRRSDALKWMVVEPAGGPQARCEVWPENPTTCARSKDSEIGAA
ncbi:MAG: hypothetical protein ACE5I3_03165 [Phycisphaerae bacterium]